MSAETSASLDEMIDRGLAAVETDDLDAAESILDEVRGNAGENHVRVLHLAGLLAWAQEDVARATGYLMQAADLSPDRAEIYLDCAECLFTCDEVDEAEEQVRAALRLTDAPRQQLDEARLLLAQVRLADDDPDEALEVLGEIDESLKEHPAFLSTHGAALLAADRVEESIASLRRAVEKDETDADLYYQLGVALDICGRHDEAREAMVKVAHLDVREWEETGEPLPDAPDYSEQQELRTRLEGVLEELPEPVLTLVASAPITVQARATEDQVKQGVNPRSSIAFEGVPKRTADDEAELKGILILRDLLLGEVESEDEIDGELFYALVDEIQFFFKRDDIVVAEA